MRHNLGNIDLFHRAFLEDHEHPPVKDYLRSVGLSESEVAEVAVLFKVFCDAIENASEARLPDLAAGPVPADSISATSIN